MAAPHVGKGSRPQVNVLPKDLQTPRRILVYIVSVYSIADYNPALPVVLFRCANDKDKCFAHCPVHGPE